MKFKFCGDRDCPDWVLASANTLAKLTSVKTRLLAKNVADEIVRGGDVFDVEGVQKWTADAHVSLDEVLAVVGVLAFILKASAKYDVDGRVLDSELQQLGLPKEHAASTGRVFSAEKSRLAAALSLTSLRLTSCVEVARCGVERLQGSDAPDLEMVELVLTYKSFCDAPATEEFLMTKLKFKQLLDNLRRAQSIMRSLN